MHYFFILLFLSFSLWGSEGVIEHLQDHYKASTLSQKRIDALDEQTRELYEKYRAHLEDIKRVNTYNTHLESMLNAQKEDIASLDEQINAIKETHQSIVPLMMRMLNALDQFITLDTPFLLKERTERLEALKQMMPHASISVAEKYRKIMEAYTTELDYARTIEAYRADLEGRSVDFLRIGRVELYYQTLDGKESGMWNTHDKKWAVLNDTATRFIKQGLLMARKQSAPDLLTLPINTIEQVR